MSAPVDVLAVMERAAREAVPLAFALDVDNACDAVAELIEAAKLVDRHYPCTANEHVVRMRAALVRVQGGAA